MKVKVVGKFPGMNDIVAASKKHYACYSKMKKTYTELFQWQLKKIQPIEGKAVINITWYFKNKKRDPDNMMASQKFILDALVRNGVLVDDTISFLDSINHRFVLCSENSVEIEVLPLQPQPSVSVERMVCIHPLCEPEVVSR